MIIDFLDPGFVAPNEGALRTATFRYIVEHVVAAEHGTRLVDLGAGPCRFSEIATEQGLAVTAVDGRTERLPSLMRGFEFVKADVRHFQLANFEIVLALGLLYHLTLEDQSDLLIRAAGTAKWVIVDTQVHIPDLTVESSCSERGDWHKKLVTRGGYEGVMFPEAENPMASIGNRSSWWHTELSIERLFSNCGYRQLTKIGLPYVSKYGARRWYVART